MSRRKGGEGTLVPITTRPTPPEGSLLPDLRRSLTERSEGSLHPEGVRACVASELKQQTGVSSRGAKPLSH